MSNTCSPQIQRRLNDLYKGNPFQAQTGILDFAFSPANGSAVQANMVQQNGMNSVYSITRRASLCTAVVATGTVACADAGTDYTSLTSCDTFNSFSGYESQWHNVLISAFRDLGSTTVLDVLSGAVYDQIQKLKAAVSLDVLTSVNTNVGSISTSTATRTLKLIDDTTKAPVWAVDTAIGLDFRDAGFNEQPILVGNRTLEIYKTGVNRGGLNRYGQQLGQINTLNAFYDFNVNSTNTAPTNQGNDVLFAIMPQIVNVLSWSAYGGMFSSRINDQSFNNIDPMRLVNSDNTTFIHTMLTDPATGMLFDFTLVYDPKCEKFMFKVRTYYKTLVLPLVGCKDSAFNGIVKYDVCPVSDVFCNNP
jgi:hypothetical protein